MGELLLNRNFIAKEDMKCGQIVAWPATNNPQAPQVEVATNVKTQVIGISFKDVKAGEMCTYHPFITGEIVQLLAGGSVTAGVPLGVNSAGKIVDAAEGTAALPMFSVEAASDGELFSAITVHTNSIL